MAVSSLYLDNQYTPPAIDSYRTRLDRWTDAQVQAVANECGHVMSAPYVGSGYDFARLLLAYEKEGRRPADAPIVFDQWNATKGHN